MTGQVFNVDGGWTAGVSQHLMQAYKEEISFTTSKNQA
jgi:hypothetical protein